MCFFSSQIMNDEIRYDCQDYEDRRQIFASIVSCLLTQAIAKAPKPHAINMFTMIVEPKISLSDYIQRLVQYAECSPESLLVAVIYLNRIHFLKSILLNPFSAHRLFLAALRLATKFHDDQPKILNDFFAEVGGVPLKELNELEAEFLMQINCDLFVSFEE